MRSNTASIGVVSAFLAAALFSKPSLATESDDSRSQVLTITTADDFIPICDKLEEQSKQNAIPKFVTDACKKEEDALKRYKDDLKSIEERYAQTKKGLQGQLNDTNKNAYADYTRPVDPSTMQSYADRTNKAWEDYRTGSILAFNNEQYFLRQAGLKYRQEADGIFDKVFGVNGLKVIESRGIMTIKL